jgi:histone deacetylase 11
MVGGTVAASLLALHHGWSINLGGGMHHAHYEDGGGWCVYSDIGCSQWYLRHMMMMTEGGGEGAGITNTTTTTTTTTTATATNFLIIDLDVHQGNGLERDKLRIKKSTIIVDIYNKDIYPMDGHAREGITIERRIGSGTGDEEYLKVLRSALDEVAAGISNGTYTKPDLLYYNAGTDILAGDPLGCLNVSEEGVVKRDEMVFQLAVDIQCPIVMLLSGGYTKQSAPTVVASVRNLYDVFHLHNL